jgi:hypothetical protein
MLTCKQYTELLHKKEVVSLKRHERTKMFFHKIMCKLCRRYTKENKMINRIFLKYKECFFKTNQNNINQQKEEIIKKIKDDRNRV